jgi:cobalt-zinc-cadmium efflux system protein
MPASASATILQAIRDELGQRFHIHHTTIQFELTICDVGHGCIIPLSPGHVHEHGSGRSH